MQVEEWLQLAQRHLDNHAYTHAREAMEKLLDQRPDRCARPYLPGPKSTGQEQRDSSAESGKETSLRRCAEFFNAARLIRHFETGALYSKRPPEPDHILRSSHGFYQKLYDEVRSKRDQLRAQRPEPRTTSRRESTMRRI